MSTTVVVIGDGPAGLSAALLLAKAGHRVTVLGLGETGAKSAFFRNYLGLPDTLGVDFYEVASEQVRGFGADIRRDGAVSVEQGDYFTVGTAGGARIQGRYLILAEGKKSSVAKMLGLVNDDGQIAVDGEFRAEIERVYVVGRSIRPKRSQAIISAGAGATAALDILAIEAGTHVQDWDTPPSE